MILIYLESELHILNHENIFVNGCFSVCRNVEFNQTFSYPFLNFLMIKRSKNNYIQILNFCKKIYHEKFNCDLKISTFHCDAEIAFIRAAEFVFPTCQIMLCSVHLIRTFQKNYVKSFWKFPCSPYFTACMESSLWLYFYGLEKCRYHFRIKNFSP